MRSELSDTGNVTFSPQGMLVQAPQMKGEWQAIQLEAADLDVRRGRHFVAIGEEKGSQALILRRGWPGRENQEKRRASRAAPTRVPPRS
jgi:hypothetical protein